MNYITIPLLMILTVNLHASDYYVSPAGNDHNPGSKSSPFKTITAAAKAAEPGDTIHINAGHYQGPLIIEKSGQPGAPITFLGELSATGKRLAVIESGQPVKGWVQTGECGGQLWRAPLDFVPSGVDIDGFQIVLLSQRRMQLPPLETSPEELTEDMIWAKPPTARLPGMNLLKLPSGAMASHFYFKGIKVPLWPVIGNVMAGYADGMIHLRLADGRNPNKLNIRVFRHDGIIVRNHSHLVFRNLEVRESSRQFVLDGPNTANVVIDNNRMSNGVCRVLITNGAHGNTVSNNELTLGFIQPENFTANTGNDQRGRLLYLVFKYLASPIDISDDKGIMVSNAGADNKLFDNLIFRGLIGIQSENTPGIIVRDNIIREMSSVGYSTRGGGCGVFHDNLIWNCGINIRIHNFAAHGKIRDEYHHHNVSIQPDNAGSHIHVHFANPQTKYAAMENIYFYHNTFSGGNSFFSSRKLFRKLGDKQKLNFLFINNICTVFTAANRHNRLFLRNLMPTTGIYDETPVNSPETVNDNIVVSDKLFRDGVFLPDDSFPAVSLSEDSPARHTGIDLSKPFSHHGENFPPMPEMLPGYFTGKAPDIGALQYKNSRHAALHARFIKSEQSIEETRPRP